MRIGELAVRSSLTVKTIRFYEQVGVLPEPARRESGYRDYDETAAARLQFVKAAQTAGLTLAQIREVIAVRDQSGPPCRHVVELLDAHADSLDRRIADLTALRDDVRRLQDRAATLDPASCRSATVCQVIPVAGQPVGQAASLGPAARPPASATDTSSTSVVDGVRAAAQRRAGADGLVHARADVSRPPMTGAPSRQDVSGRTVEALHDPASPALRARSRTVHTPGRR